jgi:hypothetical protein
MTIIMEDVSCVDEEGSEVIFNFNAQFSRLDDIKNTKLVCTFNTHLLKWEKRLRIRRRRKIIASIFTALVH